MHSSPGAHHAGDPRPGKPTGKLRAVVTLLRPRQWVKNGFVLAPLMFAGKFTDPHAITLALVAAAIFCATASAAYVLNDIRDIEHDRLHPTKSQKRPLAAGHLGIGEARVLLAVLYAIVALGGIALPAVGAVALAYLLLNVAYSLALKHTPVVDIFVVATGFVLRVYAGAVAIDAPLSGWMFITTLCLALYLAAIKRRQELLAHGCDSRSVLGKYTPQLVERYAEISATGALVFYSLYVMSSNPKLVATVPLVIYGLFRYWYLVDARQGGESPTDELLSDPQLIGIVFVWAGVAAWALWPAAGG